MKVLLGIILSLSTAGFASADSIWSYTGNVMDGHQHGNGPQQADCGCSLDGTVTLNDAGVATSWSFTDGFSTLTNLNSTGMIDPFYHNPGGSPFTTWLVSLNSGGVTFWSDAWVAGEETDAITDGVHLGFEEGTPGIWSDPVGTAEPATGILVGLSLAIAGLMRRRKKRPLDTAHWEQLG